MIAGVKASVAPPRDAAVPCYLYYLDRSVLCYWTAGEQGVSVVSVWMGTSIIQVKRGKNRPTVQQEGWILWEKYCVVKIQQRFSLFRWTWIVFMLKKTNPTKPNRAGLRGDFTGDASVSGYLADLAVELFIYFFKWSIAKKATEVNGEAAVLML